MSKTRKNALAGSPSNSSAKPQLAPQDAQHDGANDKATQSRINGAKSHGPSTPQGRANSIAAHMVHGFRAKTVAIHSEDQAAYDARLDEYTARYNPADAVEADLVGLLAANMWQIKRLISIESAYYDIEIAGMDASIDENFKRIDEYGRLALAFKKSAGDGALDLLRRYRSTAERAYHRTFQALEKIKEDRQRQQPQNEISIQPKTTPELAPKSPQATQADLSAIARSSKEDLSAIAQSATAETTAQVLHLIPKPALPAKTGTADTPTIVNIPTERPKNPS